MSCVTAKHVLDAIRPDQYTVIPVGISRDGDWSIASIDRDAEALDPTGRPTDPFTLFADAAGNGVVLPLLHGPLGEDGTVQGLCELTGIAYVGAGVLGSALAMDKIAAKNALAAAGVPQARCVGFNADQITEATAASVLERFGSPVFVKPANMGSSVGVSRAVTADEVSVALDLAASFDEWIVVEEAIAGREIEISVLGNRSPRTSLPGEIVAGDEFYTYEDKYNDGIAKLLIPAPLTTRRLPRSRRWRSRISSPPSGRLGSRRLLLRSRRPRLAGQRAQHDARIHPDLDVPEDVERIRTRLSGSHRRAHRIGVRTTQPTSPQNRHLVVE